MFGLKKGALDHTNATLRWSFVSNKDNKQWIWLAMDVNTGEIVGVYVGQRSREGAHRWWRSFVARGVSAVRCMLYRFLVSL